MDFLVYRKYVDSFDIIEPVLQSLIDEHSSIVVYSDSRRSFNEFDRLISKVTDNSIVVINEIGSLGLNDAEIAERLSWFITNNVLLVICAYKATYDFGVFQPTNKAVLNTILQNLLQSNKNIVEIPRNKRNNSGRNKIAFPENWDELYFMWKNKKITSKQFLEETHLKKATFYNLLTEYEDIQSSMNDFKRKFEIS